MEPSADRASGNAVTLDELAALNDEMVALIRAGVPLESGLREVAQDHPQPLGTIAAELAERLSRGESLDAALSADGTRFPRSYCAVVAAGLHAGRLTVALESVSQFALQLADLRRRIALALVYPVLVLILAYGLFVVFVLDVSERLRETHESFQIPPGWSLAGLVSLKATLIYWVWVPPLLLLLAIVWWSRGDRSSSLSSTAPEWPLRWLPGVRSIFFHSRLANFADLLAILIDHGVAMGTAVVLAADAAGDAAMQRSARALAESTNRGSLPAEGVPDLEGFPAFLVWLLARGEQQDALAAALRLAGDMYRRRALQQIEWTRLIFPIVAGIVVGGGATLFYALILFMPFRDLLNALTAT